MIGGAGREEGTGDKGREREREGEWKEGRKEGEQKKVGGITVREERQGMKRPANGDPLTLNRSRVF